MTEPPVLAHMSGCERTDSTLDSSRASLDSGVAGMSECPTEGGVSLTVTGKNFGEGMQMDIDSQPCYNLTLLSSQTSQSPNDADAGDSESVSSSYDYDSFTCILPSGVGSNLDVLLSIRITDSVSSSSLIPSLLSYAPPTIIQVVHPNCTASDPPGSLANCPREGGGVLTVSGMNFGAAGSVVLVGNRVCGGLVHSPDNPHVLVFCDLPSGSETQALVLFIQRYIYIIYVYIYMMIAPIAPV